MEIKLNHNIEFILNLLKEEGQGYIVGGFVRDIFLGLNPKDCDFVTDIEYERLKEIFIQKELEELSKGRTTLVVAHRLSTIKNADEIFVIQNGNIKEKGNHNELLEAKGIYYNLYSSMFNN